MTFTCVPNRLSAPPESRNTLSHYSASCSELIMKQVLYHNFRTKCRLWLVEFLASFTSSSFLGHVYHTAKRSCNHHHHALHDPHANGNKQLTHSTTHTTYARRPTSQVTAGFVGRSVRPLAGGAVWRAHRDVERLPYQCTLTGVQPGWMMHCLTTSSYLSPVTSKHARGLQNMIS